MIELRARNARNNGEHRTRRERTKGAEKVIIERKLKPGDNLNKISLQYSVSISDLKRANNIVSEQDIYALPFIKIPVSRLRVDLDSAQQNENDSYTGEPVIIERKLKPGDNLNKISLQYSVSVSDLKRANNIVSEQDIYALPSIKIPVSRLRVDLDSEQQNEDDSCTGEPVPEEFADDRPLLGSGNHSDKSVDELFEKTDATIAQVRNNLPVDTVDGAFHFVDASSPDTTFRGLWLVLPLLASGNHSDKSVDELFEKTDATIAQVRSNLPVDTVDGAFHFVDASSPDTTFRGLWLVLFFVIFLFIFVPLLLTFVEEEQTEEHVAKKIS
ncbi:unnamed protein product [Gongylonema pulchrum]|uniref:LysM domain-containing protein n=1 Tax=Gongylonema pulchrum TaxID=637853 RepID=A0A183E3F6_9BILA|nr:unnamed protein product [Gongylonema pulchrum]